LVAAAQNAAKSLGDVREITVQDLMAAASESAAPERSSSGSRRDAFLARLLTAYAVLGAGVAATASIAIALTQERSASSSTTFLVAATATGAALALASTVLFTLRQQQRLRTREVEAGSERSATVAFLLRWAELENRIRSVGAGRLGDSEVGVPISILV